MILAKRVAECPSLARAYEISVINYYYKVMKISDYYLCTDVFSVAEMSENLQWFRLSNQLLYCSLVGYAVFRPDY